MHKESLNESGSHPTWFLDQSLLRFTLGFDDNLVRQLPGKDLTSKLLVINGYIWILFTTLRVDEDRSFTCFHFSSTRTWHYRAVSAFESPVRERNGKSSAAQIDCRSSTEFTASQLQKHAASLK